MKKLLLLVVPAVIVVAAIAFIRRPPPPQRQSRSHEPAPNGKPCPDPFVLRMPVDITKATSVLYPGQIRGGEFKAHGGFRFDTSQPSDITVVAPYDAQVIAGARYPVEGEIQYTFDFAHPCGMRYRFGHLLTLSPKFQAIAEKFPLPTGLDSRTTQVWPPVDVKLGEVIATAVGMTRGGPDQLRGLNAFVDWGVYDYRQKNEDSQRPDWPTRHASEDSNWSTYYNSDTYLYAVCLFDYLSPEDRQKVLSLPAADGRSGKTSDYCK